MTDARRLRAALGGVSLSLGALGALIVVASEVVERWASRRMLGSPSAGGTEAIVVLGYGNRGSRANAVNRFRVRVAVRSVDPAAERTVLVCSGGGVHSDTPEAHLLRAAALDAGWTGDIVVEDASRTTAQNIDLVAPIVAGFDAVRIASNPLHALKAREYAWRHHPELARRLAPADDHRWGEALWLKPIAAGAAWAGLRRRRAARRRALGAGV